MQRRRRRRGLNLDRRILILLAVAPFGCLMAILAGLFVTWFVSPTRFVNARASDLSEEYAQEIVIMAAADYAENEDIDRAKEILERLEVPNPTQYVSLVAEEMIRTNRGSVEDDIKNVVFLARALGVSTVSMVAYVSPPTATFTPTETSTPSPTPTNTRVVDTPTPPPPPAEDEANADSDSGEEIDVAEAQVDAAVVEQAAVDLPLPTETPVPPPPATNTPAPPTETPTPEATPTPESEFDFRIVKERLLTRDENGGCAGNHNIFIDVLDAAGNPIKGVQLGDVWNNPGPVTGHKGDDRPGRAEYDLYKDSGFHVLVKSDPTAGREVTSEVTGLLSADDWKIGIPNLIEAGYCPDEGTCEALWNSGTFGVGSNSLCWGHYSWEVVFQRTW
ncbi:MAG: hypothetical protein KDJ65_09530 [Anaerolineae bacterium]|nr:hypothetical protein [Anaerolineae bacterium]